MKLVKTAMFATVSLASVGLAVLQPSWIGSLNAQYTLPGSVDSADTAGDAVLGDNDILIVNNDGGPNDGIIINTAADTIVQLTFDQVLGAGNIFVYLDDPNDAFPALDEVNLLEWAEAATANVFAAPVNTYTKTLYFTIPAEFSSSVNQTLLVEFEATVGGSLVVIDAVIFPGSAHGNVITGANGFSIGFDGGIDGGIGN